MTEPPQAATAPPVRLLALGGSTRPGSSAERALRLAGSAAAAAGAEVTYLTGRALILPIYDTETTDRSTAVLGLVAELRRAEGLLLASPGYHGAVSGLVKNALDYAEDLRFDEPPYLDGRAIGCIAVAHGWQTSVATLNQLRQVAHALRAWPTPLGCALNDSTSTIGDDHDLTDPDVSRQLTTLGQQVVEFVQARAALRDTR